MTYWLISENIILSIDGSRGDYQFIFEEPRLIMGCLSPLTLHVLLIRTMIGEKIGLSPLSRRSLRMNLGLWSENNTSINLLLVYISPFTLQ